SELWRAYGKVTDAGSGFIECRGKLAHHPLCSSLRVAVCTCHTLEVGSERRLRCHCVQLRVIETKLGAEALAQPLRQLRKRVTKSCDVVGVPNQRPQIGIGKVAAVVTLLLGPCRANRAARCIPDHRLLPDDLASIQHRALALEFALQ